MKDIMVIYVLFEIVSVRQKSLDGRKRAGEVVGMCLQFGKVGIFRGKNAVKL